ncbi:MAG TPA: hypothetical protein VG142_09785 [Trebonia sp.]|nr:hypothetical protein [Trebonia sp.]
MGITAVSPSAAAAKSVSATSLASAAGKKWGCTATDNGAENPGPSCPAGNHYYQDSAITNSDGYNTLVINDMWDPPGKGNPQTIYADSPADWEVVADMPKDNTAVLSYPDIQQIFTQTNDAPAALSGFSDIHSDFRETMPATGDNEAAYDIWLGTSEATDYSREVMIWVDNHRTNSPPGKIVGTPSFYKTVFRVWDDDGTIYMVRELNETSGRIYFLPMLDWLVAHGYLPRHSGLNQINFGWEICSTNGRPLTFAVSAYDLRSTCVKRGTACWSS